MKFHVDAWDPGFGASIEGSDRGPAEASSAKLDPEIELPSASWRPLDTPPGVRAPDVVLLVDGVRRTDARLWIEDHDGVTRPGLASALDTVDAATPVTAAMSLIVTGRLPSIPPGKHRLAKFGKRLSVFQCRCYGAVWRHI